MTMQAATLEVLEQAEVPPRQARAIAQAIEIEIAAGRADLATRHDLRDLSNELRLEIAAVRTELKGDIAELRTELKGDIAGLRTEFANLRTDVIGGMGNLKAEVVRWVLLTMLGQTALLLGVGYFLLDHLK